MFRSIRAKVQPLKQGGLHLWWLVLLVLGLDQVTKIAVSSALSLYEQVPVLPFFNIVLVHNEGAAFSFLANAGGWQRWFFSIVAACVSLFILVWLYGNARKYLWVNTALSLILGGALGNLWDRVRLGYVVDFLDFYWQTMHFPAFNLADSAISVGAFMLIVDMFRGDSQPQEDRSK